MLVEHSWRSALLKATRDERATEVYGPLWRDEEEKGHRGGLFRSMGATTGHQVRA